MAGDTRQVASATALAHDPAMKSVPPSPDGEGAGAPAGTQRTYETFRAPVSANLMPGGTENTAGGKQEDITLEKVVKSIKLEDFRKVHKQPCVRDALLLGIGGGFGLGGIRAILGGTYRLSIEGSNQKLTVSIAPIPTASNWAVGSFIGVSLVAYEFCQYRRNLELQGMRQAMEIIDQKKAEKAEKLRLAREARRKTKEEDDRREEEAKKQNSSGWKFW